MFYLEKNKFLDSKTGGMAMERCFKALAAVFLVASLIFCLSGCIAALSAVNAAAQAAHWAHLAYGAKMAFFGIDVPISEMDAKDTFSCSYKAAWAASRAIPGQWGVQKSQVKIVKEPDEKNNGIIDWETNTRKIRVVVAYDTPTRTNIGVATRLKKEKQGGIDADAVYSAEVLAAIQKATRGKVASNGGH